MAEGWKHVMQQDQLGVKEIQKYLEKVVPLVAIDGLDSLTSTITSEEIRAAIKRCKRGKAYGPDEICNDWYRDHHEQLTPILEKIMNLWYSTGIVPQSFKDANIHCLKKTKTASRPLDHRPIALLNIDYKVYTRIFATRLRPLLPHLVHTLQAGFVPGRSIHTPIDTFLAIRKVADRDPRLAKGIGLLLDFAKAYDSLNRAFLVCVLQLYGFPKIFVDMVAVLHEDTARRFLVNGFLSSKIQVSCGIRQGCPLAPLLFIIALDVLYRVVETMPDIGGIPLVCGSSTTIRISGYTDDTALYLADADDIPKILEVIRDYGSVSGLQVNLKKPVGVMMSTRSHGVETNGYGIPILQHGDSTRYLGIQVGSFDTHDASWGGCVAALRSRLALAFAKTHSVTQRAEIVKAIVVPKVLYLAHHSWPMDSVMEELHRFIKSFVWGKNAGRRRRAWLSEEQAELPLSEGGIALPNIKTEILTMAATTVAKWASNSTKIKSLIGDLLLNLGAPNPVYITPHTDVTQHRRALGPSLWGVGAAIVQAAYASPYSEEETRSIRKCAHALVKGYQEAHWENGTYVVDVRRHINNDVTHRMTLGKTLRGAFCAEWLGLCSTTQDGWLLDRQGTTYLLSRAGIARGTRELKDLVQWTWHSQGKVLFQFVPGWESATAPSLRSFQRLCFALLYNYPQLLFRPASPTLLWPYNTGIQQHHEWHLTHTHTLKHYDATLLTAKHQVETSSDLDTAASADVQSAERIRFHAHPATSRLVQVWGGERRWTASRRRYMCHITKRRAEQGQEARNRTAALPTCSKALSTPMQAGLSTLKWSRIQRLTGLNTYERQLLYRLKAGKLSLWNHRDSNVACPSAQCSATHIANSSHVFWECPEAEALWRPTLNSWQGIGLDLTGHAEQAIFGFRLLDAPKMAWKLMTEVAKNVQLHEQHQDLVFPMAEVLWQYYCGSTITNIWRFRNLLMNEDAPSRAAFLAGCQARLRSGLNNIRFMLPTNSSR
jgi:hypothetical protein